MIETFSTAHRRTIRFHTRILVFTALLAVGIQTCHAGREATEGMPTNSPFETDSDSGESEKRDSDMLTLHTSCHAAKEGVPTEGATLFDQQKEKVNDYIETYMHEDSRGATTAEINAKFPEMKPSLRLAIRLELIAEGRTATRLPEEADPKGIKDMSASYQRECRRLIHQEKERLRREGRSLPSVGTDAATNAIGSKLQDDPLKNDKTFEEVAERAFRKIESGAYSIATKRREGSPDSRARADGARLRGDLSDPQRGIDGMFCSNLQRDMFSLISRIFSERERYEDWTTFLDPYSVCIQTVVDKTESCFDNGCYRRRIQDCLDTTQKLQKWVEKYLMSQDILQPTWEKASMLQAAVQALAGLDPAAPGYAAAVQLVATRQLVVDNTVVALEAAPRPLLPGGYRSGDKVTSLIKFKSLKVRDVGTVEGHADNDVDEDLLVRFEDGTAYNVFLCEVERASAQADRATAASAASKSAAQEKNLMEILTDIETASVRLFELKERCSTKLAELRGR